MPRKPAVERGPALLAALLAALTRPDGPIGDPIPLADLRAAEDAAGVALSPSMVALLRHDIGWMRRTYAWFDTDGRLQARPFADLVAARAGPLAAGFADILHRFPANALPLDADGDSARFLYLGDPDELGEYPVLGIDHGDRPAMDVCWAGFDTFLADALEVPVKKPIPALDAAQKRLFGRKSAWAVDDPGRPTKPVPGPKPGSVRHAEPPEKPAI